MVKKGKERNKYGKRFFNLNNKAIIIIIIVKFQLFINHVSIDVLYLHINSPGLVPFESTHVYYDILHLPNIISNLILLQVLPYLHNDVLLVQINDGRIERMGLGLI